MTLSIIKRVLGYIKPYKGTLIVAIICTIINVSLVLLVPILIGHAIDYIIDIGKVDFNMIFMSIIEIIIIALLASLAQLIMGICIAKVTHKTTRDIRNDVIKKIHKLPLNYLDTTPNGNTINIMINAIDSVASGLQQSFTQWFVGIATVIETLIFMFSINPLIAWVVIILTPISVLVAYSISKHSYNSFRMQVKVQDEISGHIEEMVSNQKIVKAFNYEERSIDKFKEINERLYESGTKAQFYSSLSNPSIRFVNVIIYTAVGIIGSLLLILTGSITIGEIFSFLSYANQYTKPFNEITGILTQVQTAFAAAARIFKLLDEDNELLDSKDSIELKDCKGKVELKHVYFSYVPSIQLIQDFNLVVNPGQRIAIVGPTGCGKTTLINLLMRFYDVNSGVISIDGVPIDKIKRDNLRGLFGMVLQETWLFAGTIADNIAYSDRSISIEKIKDAAKKAHAHDFIKRFSSGYDTIISENGENLSQGERQLISIARVMLTDPPMLILDEATSNIDTITELEIQKAFKTMMKGRTSFVVAHRLSTIKEADTILVMNNGNIIEQGTHEELINNGGFYNNLYRSQFSIE